MNFKVTHIRPTDNKQLCNVYETVVLWYPVGYITIYLQACTHVVCVYIIHVFWFINKYACILKVYVVHTACTVSTTGSRYAHRCSDNCVSIKFDVVVVVVA